MASRNNLLKALCLPIHPPDAEIAEKQVKEWQGEVSRLVRDIFSRMRRYLDGQSAATAAKTGDSRQAQVIAKWLALWAEQERQVLETAQGAKLANEARQWYVRQLEHGKVDSTEPFPKLLVWLVAAEEISRTTDDRGLGKAMREIIIQDALAIGAPGQPDGGGEEATDDSAFVPAVSLWKDRFDNYKAAKRFLDKHPEIRTRKPGKQRLEIHAGDWTKHWGNHDLQSFDALDQTAPAEITSLLVENVKGRYNEHHAAKQRQQPQGDSSIDALARRIQAGK